MKTYEKPATRTISLRTEGLIALSKHDEEGGDQLTRGRREGNGSFGSGLWDEEE